LKIYVDVHIYQKYALLAIHFCAVQRLQVLLIYDIL